jgi:hypothetical protein
MLLVTKMTTTKLILDVNILQITGNIHNFLGYRFVDYVGRMHLCGWTISPIHVFMCSYTHTYMSVWVIGKNKWLNGHNHTLDTLNKECVGSSHKTVLH